MNNTLTLTLVEAAFIMGAFPALAGTYIALVINEWNDLQEYRYWKGHEHILSPAELWKWHRRTYFMRAGWWA